MKIVQIVKNVVKMLDWSPPIVFLAQKPSAIALLFFWRLHCSRILCVFVERRFGRLGLDSFASEGSRNRSEVRRFGISLAAFHRSCIC